MLGDGGFSYSFRLFHFSHEEVKRAVVVTYRFFSLHSSPCIRLFVPKNKQHMISKKKKKKRNNEEMPPRPLSCSILLHILSPLVSLGYHPALLKVAKGLVLDKPGKPSYESLSSIRIIVLLWPVSKILERKALARLLLAACSRALIHRNQCGSLPGLSTYDAWLTLMNDVNILQRGRLMVSFLFLDIKAGFDNVDNPIQARILTEGGSPPSLVSSVSSFLGGQSYTLVFQGTPGPPARVNVGAPQGSPISPLLSLFMYRPSSSGFPED